MACTASGLASPLQVDSPIAVGELALFVALADGWPVKSRAAAGTVTALRLAVSVDLCCAQPALARSRTASSTP
jgi:hypothetical protein